MANPSLLGSFAGSSTNKVVPSAGLQANGYSFEEILASGNYNYMIEQLYAASNKSKYDGIWDWESGTYELGALVKHIGSTWESTAGSNTSEPGIANWKPYVYKAEVTHDIVIGEVTTGSATIVLTPSENASKRIIITDSGPLTSLAGELIVSSYIREFVVVNDDNQDYKVWVGSGGFVTLLAGESAKLYCDGTDVADNGTPFGINQKRVDVSGIRAIGVPEQNLTERAISILVSTSTTAAANLSLIVNGGQITRISMSANVVYTIEHKILPNDTYQINIDAGTTTVYFWTEIGR